MSATIAYGPAVIEAARGLLALKDDYYAAVRASGEAARADRLTGREVDAVLSAGRTVDEACEDFRRRYFPESGRVIAALGMVCVASPKGRRTRIVYDRDRDDLQG